MRHVRIFVSSPSDATHERLRVERVVQRLNAEFSEVAHLEAFRWETEFYQAYATFQAQIAQASDCDIVIAIFRGRIGTELPPSFTRMPDSSAYPSGTAYELLTAMDARRETGAPDVYVFRYDQPPVIRLDDPNADRIANDWRHLKEFFETWFQTPDGHFTAAYQTFSSTDGFEADVTRLLRRWLEEKVLRSRALSWPVAVLGSPFRGLAAFGAKHASVFFGRSRDIGRTIDLLKRAGEGRCPFLLLVGASGAGKSSLARAGIIPRLTAPGVVAEVDVWRVAALRPSEVPGGPVLTLATRLLDGDDDIPAEEEGRPRALPELAESDLGDAAHLAALCRQAPELAASPVLHCLERVGEAERGRHSYDRPVRADLLILVDQLDELFAPYIEAEERAIFAKLLDQLVATGRVWVVATLRADLYELFLTEPSLLTLKSRGASYDLVPPGSAELSEIVRKPAEAAGLEFESDPLRRESLDERLLHEADRPDMLPLLQLMLNRLFEMRTVSGDKSVLTFAAERELGGLAGVIDREGERAVADLDEAELAALPRLLRRLAAMSRPSDSDPSDTMVRVTIRTVPLNQAAQNEAAHRLVQALLDARLLLTSGDGITDGIRLAHERVLTDWARAHELVAANAEFYRVREEIEEAQRRWEVAKQSRDLLIPRGLPLAEAEAVLDRFGTELAPAAREFITASSRRARRRHHLALAAAVMFGWLAIAASAGVVYAKLEQQRASRSLDAAKHAVQIIVRDVANGLRNVQGIGTDKIRIVLEDIRQTVQNLAREAPNDRAVTQLNLEMLDEFATTYFAVNDLDRAQASAAAALELARARAAQDPDPEWLRSIAVSLTKIGAVKLRRGEIPAALRADREAVETSRRLLAGQPANALWQRDLSAALGGIGDVRVQTGEAGEAVAAYEEASTLLRHLLEQTPNDLELKGRLAQLLNKKADVELNRGAAATARARYDEAIKINRELTRREPGNLQWQRGMFVGLTRIADMKRLDGDTSAALAHYEQALTLMQYLADVDRGNPQMRWDLAATQLKIGDLRMATGARQQSAASYEAALDIMRELAKSDLANSLWQRDLAVSLNKAGDARLLSGETAQAEALYNEALAIVRRLVNSDAEDAIWVRDLAVTLGKAGTLKLRAGDIAAATADFEHAVEQMGKLAKRDPDNAGWRRDLSIAFNKLGDAKRASNDLRSALESYQQALSLIREIAEKDRDNINLQGDLTFTLNRVGDVRARLQDVEGSRTAFREALRVARILAEHDPNNAPLQTGLAASLYRLARVEAGKPRHDALHEALEILEPLQRAAKLNADQSAWPGMIRDMLKTEASDR